MAKVDTVNRDTSSKSLLSQHRHAVLWHFVSIPVDAGISRIVFQAQIESCADRL
jgi:hypothetical protein